ncbi:hypothetical protein [Fervidobacterium sp.]
MKEYLRVVYFILALLVLGLAGFYTTYVTLKVVFAFFAVVVLGYFLKGYTGRMIGFIILSILLFLIPMASITSFEYLAKSGESGLKRLMNFSETLTRRSGKVYNPDVRYDETEELIFDINAGLRLEFVDEPGIVVPSTLKVKQTRGVLEIRGGEKNSTYVVKVGGEKLERINISSFRLDVNGKFEKRLKRFVASAVGMSINGELISDVNELDSTGVELLGTLSADDMTINSVGVELNGEISADKIEIDSVGVNMKLKLRNCSYMDISSTGVNGKLEFLGGKALRLKIDSTGGKLYLKNSSDSDITINSSGVKVVRE